MKIMAFIPARGGSKGVPGKNKKILGDKPLVAWTIKDALDARMLDRVVVSTEDPEIQHIAACWGAEVVRRPEDLATDTASLDQVFFHTLDRVRAGGYEPDYVVVMSPTSPFRREGLVDQALETALSDRDICYVHALRPIPFHLEDLVYPDSRVFMNESIADELRNSAFCLSMNFGVERMRPGGTVRRGLVLQPDECVDIDLPEDWRLAEEVSLKWH